MAGALEWLMNPANQGLLGLSAGLLQAAGPSRMPVPFGSALGQGINSGLQSLQGAQLMQQRQALTDLEKAKVAMTEQQLKQAQAQFALQQGILQRAGLIPGEPQGALSAQGPSAIPASLQSQPTPPSATQAPGRGGFPFDLNQLTAMRLAGMPDLLPNYKESQPNVSNQNGFLIDPRVGIVGSVPQTNQQGFSTMTVRDPNGEFRVVQVPGGGEAFRQQQLMTHAATSAYGSPVTIPPSSPSASPTLANPYRFAVSQGAPDVLGGAQARPGAGGGAGGVGVPAGLSADQQATVAANTEQQKDVAKNYATIYNNLQNASMANPAKVAKIQRIGELLKDFEGGKLSKTAMVISQAANSAGIKIDPKLPNKEAAEALSGEIALELRSTANGNGMPGAMSDADREFLKGMTPQLGLTAEGRRTIIETKTKVLERESQVAKMARQYRQKYGGLNEDFFNQLQAWSERNPIFK